MRFKHNIETLSSSASLAAVLKLRPVSYQWNPDHAAFDGREHVGFIAEEVLAIDPRLVAFEADGKTAFGLKYDRMTSILAGAIQELNLKVEAVATSAKQVEGARGASNWGEGEVGSGGGGYASLPSASLAGYCSRGAGCMASPFATAPATYSGGACGCLSGWTSRLTGSYTSSGGCSGTDLFYTCVKD
jgi:hypothetical protein